MRQPWGPTTPPPRPDCSLQEITRNSFISTCLLLAWNKVHLSGSPLPTFPPQLSGQGWPKHGGLQCQESEWVRMKSVLEPTQGCEAFKTQVVTRPIIQHISSIPSQKKHLRLLWPRFIEERAGDSERWVMCWRCSKRPSPEDQPLLIPSPELLPWERTSQVGLPRVLGFEGLPLFHLCCIDVMPLL